MLQVARSHQCQHGQVAKTVRDIKHDALALANGASQVGEDGGLLGLVAGIRNQQALHGDAQLFCQALLVDGKHLGGDGLLGHCLHQRQQAIVVGVLVVKKHVPHAAGSARKDQFLRLEVFQQCHAKKWHFALKARFKNVVGCSVAGLCVAGALAKKADECAHGAGLVLCG